MPKDVSIAYTPADIHRKPAKQYARVAVERATLDANRGIAGDLKATRSKRQLNVMLAETVAQLKADGFRTVPGELGEQLVISGLPTNVDLSGATLRIGRDAVVQLGELRTGCSRFARIQGRPPKAVEGRLGYMARVLVGGDIAIGSEVILEPSPDPTRATRARANA